MAAKVVSEIPSLNFEYLWPYLPTGRTIKHHNLE